MSKEFEANKLNAFKDYVETGLDVKFDLWATDPNDYVWLQEFFPNFKLVSAGGALPFQAEGYVEGHPFYYRSEQNSASLYVAGQDSEMPYLPEMSLWSSSLTHEDYLGNANFLNNLFTLLKSLKKAQFLYRFSCNDIKYHDQNDLSTAYVIEEGTGSVFGWGYNPVEAFEYAKKPSSYLTEHGISEEVQQFVWLTKNPNPVPINEDTRVYPDVLPSFMR